MTAQGEGDEHGRVPGVDKDSAQGLPGGSEKQKQEADRAQVQRGKQSLAARNRLYPGKGRFAERRIDGGDGPVCEWVCGVFEVAQARHVWENSVRIDVGPLDAAFPLIAVDVL